MTHLVRRTTASFGPVVSKVGGTAPLGTVRNSRGGGEAEMGGWWAIGDPVNNYISVVLLTLSDQMSEKTVWSTNMYACNL